jgi:hypothetical protein
LFLKYLICIDSIALDYRVDLLVWYPLHWQRSQNLLVCISVITAMNTEKPFGVASSAGESDLRRPPTIAGAAK